MASSAKRLLVVLDVRIGDRSDIAARIDGVFLSQQALLVFYLVLSVRGTEYRTVVWSGPTFCRPEVAIARHQRKLDGFLANYDGAPFEKICSYFLRRCGNPAVRQVLEDIGGHPPKI